MSSRARMALFLPAAGVVAILLVWGFAGLPDFGHYRGPYGLVLDRVAVHERHMTNVVTAVVFDYRGFDTLGEEFILFASVIAVALLLRSVREEQTADVVERVSGDAWRAAGTVLVGPTLGIGLYVVAHGPITPGGGFQGGVVLMAAAALIYLGGDYRSFRELTPVALVDFAEGLGAVTYVSVGLVALVRGDAYLHNVLPLGTAGTLASSGSIFVLNVATGLMVAAAFVLLAREFLEDLMVERPPRRRP
jgi:multicomponent Na+:H+ antiporter subunit B